MRCHGNELAAVCHSFCLCVKKGPSSFWPRSLFWTPPNPPLFEHFLNDLSPLRGKTTPTFQLWNPLTPPAHCTLIGPKRCQSTVTDPVLCPDWTGALGPSERRHAAHLVRQLVFVAARPDWLLIAVERSGVGRRRVAEETAVAARRPQQVVCR